MSVALYAEALLSSASVVVRERSGQHRPLATDRWAGPLDEADRAVAARPDGPTLDVGCGPGRFVAAVGARGLPALGIDISRVAVDLTRRRGGSALQRDVFGAVPGAGHWAWLLLVDGNIGIGGDPDALLTRSRHLLRPGGTAVVEVEPAGAPCGPRELRLESPGRVGPWFAWAAASADVIGAHAAAADLEHTATWEVAGRWFAELVRC